VKYKVFSNLTTYSYSVYLELDGHAISMSYDGNSKYQSTDFFEISDGNIDFFIRVNGLNGTAWNLELVITSMSDPAYKKEYKQSRAINDRGTDNFSDLIKL
jgi:hypothetical protein